jgi:hypothetical protein
MEGLYNVYELMNGSELSYKLASELKFFINLQVKFAFFQIQENVLGQSVVVHAYNTNYLVLYLEEIPGPWFKAILGKK